MVRPPRRLTLVAAALLVLSLAAPSLSAQTVRGRVLDEAGTLPMVGAVVTLLDESGARVRGTLTNDAGLFAIPAPVTGTYRLRAEMIGRQNVESAWFSADRDTPFLTLQMPIQPVVLSGIDVRSAGRCSVRRDAALATMVVWGEARKALLATSVALQEALYRFRVSVYARRVNGWTRAVIDQEVEERDFVGEDPFASLPPDELARDGYVRLDGDESWVYGPSMEVLLSSAFEETHCFGLTREGERPGAIGVTFEPVPGRGQADIEGVLWIDEASSELRTLDFRYRNVPRILIRGDYLGFAEFQRLDDGGWIIRRWWLRSPAPMARRGILTLREEGSEVVSIQRLR